MRLAILGCLILLATAPAAAQIISFPKTTARSTCPEGWRQIDHPLIGVRAHVPPDYWARMQGGTMFSVEKQDSPGTMAFLLPLRPKPGATPTQIAEHFAAFVGKAVPSLQARVVKADAERALSQFTSVHQEQPVEGRYCTIVGAGGSMAFVIGVMAPKGKLERELPTLERIAKGFGFVPARGKWTLYRSPAGGFSVQVPQGWIVEHNDGRTPKDDIDWAVKDPQKPLSRAFQWCPRFCSPQLLQSPMHAMRGYQPGEFQDHQAALVASLSQIAQKVRLRKVQPNALLTRILRGLLAETSRLLGALGAAQTDVTSYDCLAEATIDGQPVVVAFVGTVQSMVIAGGWTGNSVDLRLTLRGWCAAPKDFVNDTPVLERIFSSMQLSAAFLERITQGNAQAAGKIRETYAYMNEVDQQIRDKHWDTMDAIAEMNYDTLRDCGGYVNENTGRIEQIPADKLLKNSSGEPVSREEFERGVPLDQCTVLRGAYSDDYMKGTYGRVVFTPW